MSDPSSQAPPSGAVLEAFGAARSLVPVAGGRGHAWRAGDLILKPADLSPVEHAWHAEVLPTIRLDGFRLALPRRADDGRLVVDGWAAWGHVDGEHRSGRWPEIIEIGERLHRALANVPRPKFIATRSDPWSLGDRVAWGEASSAPYRRIDLVSRLVDLLVPIVTSSQVVHGDLTGNVLFADDLPPAVIDFSPYWRPTAYASAIVVADALVWEGADRSLVTGVLGVDAFAQYLARALIFRIVSASIGGFEGDDTALSATYRAAVDTTVDVSGAR
jgi:uncharacterized protein (TIGR02569 family)